MTTCAKVRYASLRDASAALRTLRRNATGKIPTRAYYCRRCGGHHLTSQPIAGAPR